MGATFTYRAKIPKADVKRFRCLLAWKVANAMGPEYSSHWLSAKLRFNEAAAL